MPQYFQYTDSLGRATEAECFITEDYKNSRSPNSPIMTGPSGLIDASLIPRISSQSSIKLEQITLTNSHIVQKGFELSEIPNYFLNITLIPEGAPTQRPTIDYELAGLKTISWDNKGLDGFLSEGDNVTIIYYYNSEETDVSFIPETEEIILSELDITNGYIFLQHVPTFESSMILIPDGSGPQNIGSSFTVDAEQKKVIFGDLLPLLDSDSTLTIMYYHS
jgi:hypothetical protein